MALLASSTKGSSMGTPVVTTVDAKVDAALESDLLEGFRLMNEAGRPEGLVRTELLRGQDDAWRISTTWRDFDSLMALRRSGGTHAAVELFERVGAEHSHTWFAVEQSYGDG
jgi:hypothetical protein